METFPPDTPRIHKLDREVVDKIAAGEVIARPASVVKELVENSLDAGATRVVVSLEDGGRKLISVTDNGCGIAPDDLSLAFESHATSKLETDGDLFRIGSFGFRGEALASIGAVSDARITSRRPGEATGAEVTSRGGKHSRVVEAGAPEGMTVTAANLFYNVPVRRKFLKSATTELSHIHDAVVRAALPLDNVYFRLENDGKKALEIDATGDFRERVACLWGRELADGLAEFALERDSLVVSGYAAPPAAARANARMQFVYVNQRWVRDRLLARAVAESYRDILPHRRYPVVFLFVAVDPGEVDVNVHPTKAEIRFRSPGAVYNAVYSTLRDAVRGSETPAAFSVESGATPDLSRIEAAALNFIESDGAKATMGGSSTGLFPRDGGLRDSSVDVLGDRPLGVAASVEEGVFPPPGAPSRGAYQVYNKYIIEETTQGLIIMDQHALHERILYEEIVARLKDNPLESQRLIVPDVIELGKAEEEALLSDEETLTRCGFLVEPFGTHSVAVYAVPKVLKRRDVEEFIQALADDLADSGDSAGEKLERIASVIACHAAVKAGDKLSSAEIRALVEKKEAAYSAACPHGRPTSLFISLDTIEKQFYRR